MSSQPEPSVHRRPYAARTVPPPTVRPPALLLTPGTPCPRCHGLVVVRAVVTPEGALTEHFCVGCSRSSHATPETPMGAPRLRLTPSCEAALDRACAERGCRSASEGVDDTSGIVVSRSVLDAAEIRSMFVDECLPDAHRPPR